ncbi:HD domain-containing protein [Thermodesulfobacteriota bacterium]
MPAHNSCTVPDRETCIRLMDTYAMRPNIRQHSFAVCAVAGGLAQALNAAGAALNIAEIEAAALLHDITKTRSLTTGENHSQTGAALLAQLGYPELARIVEQHVYPDSGGSALTSAELVSYADKRVLHARIVSLQARFDDLMHRYGRDDTARARIRAAHGRAREIERNILTALNTDTLNLAHITSAPAQ